MIAVDTNILIYGHRKDSHWHRESLRELTRLADGNRRWGIPWPCIHEFLSITTHPKIFEPPTPLKTAFLSIEAWLQSPLCRALGEGTSHLEALREFAERAKVEGPMIHDARIAAICKENGVTELWSADRDFSRFKGLRVTNPLVGKGP